jgi:hypothetical protein
MIGKQYLNPATILHLKQQLATYLEDRILPHLADLNGSMHSIEQSLEEISRSLNRIAHELETHRRTNDLKEEWRRW